MTGTQELDWQQCPVDDDIYAELKKRIAAEQGDDAYPMQLVGSDYVPFAEAWNMGIDAHLEALTERSSVEQVGHKAHINIHPEELPVLVRRLYQLAEDGNEEAHSLASAILSTLAIEED